MRRLLVGLLVLLFSLSFIHPLWFIRPVRAQQKKSAITEPTEEVTGPLEKVLREQEVGPLSWGNFLKHAIRRAVAAGAPPNTIVLLLLLPLIAGLISAARYLLGVTGFGIFTPAMVAVAFLATGITTGLVIFLVTLLVATLTRMLIRHFKIHYLPRMAILLWFISLGIFGIIFLSPYLKLAELTTVSIFPILFMILLVEYFIEAQVGKSMREAVGMTMETIFIALICFFLMAWETLQVFVLLNPEMVVFSVLIFDILVGHYTGFRLLEYKRFRGVFKR